MNLKIETWEDIDFVVYFSYTEYHVDFKVYEITGRSQDEHGNFTVKIYEKKGATSSEDSTEKIEEAQTFIHGTIKWDGCSHFYFGDEGYIHLCGRLCFKSITDVITRLYNKAGELMGRSEDEDFKEEAIELVKKI